jgi:DNA transformation protein
MAVGDSYLAFVIEQLEGLGRVRPRRMFGGVGLYHGERFFALLADDTLYFKVDDSNRGDYLSRGMEPFRPFPDEPERAMGYYRVPVDVIEDAESLVAWARRSVATAVPKPRRSARSGRGRRA